MAQLSTDTVFVLKRRALGEAHWSLDLFSESRGLVEAIANNARKPSKRFIGGIDYYRKLDVELAQTTRGARLRGSVPIEDYGPTITSDLLASAVAAFATEYVGAVVVSEQPEPQIFRGLQEFYDQVASAPFASLCRLQSLVLQQIGLAANLSACQCGKGIAPWRFSVRECSVLCSACQTQPSRSIAPGVVDALAARPASEANCKTAAGLLTLVLSHQIGRRLKTAAYVKQVASLHHQDDVW